MSGLAKRDGPYFDGSDMLIRLDMFGREFALIPGLSAASTVSAHDWPLGLSTGGSECRAGGPQWDVSPACAAVRMW